MKIFLAYASEDKDIAKQIYFNLRDRHKVFFDEKDLPPGTNYNSRIEEAISACDLFIFLISPDSVAKSRYTLTELEFAEKKWRHPKGHMLPVMIRTTDHDSLPASLKVLTILEPSGNKVAGVAEQVAKWKVKRTVRLSYKMAAAIVLAAIIVNGIIWFGVYRSGQRFPTYESLVQRLRFHESHAERLAPYANLIEKGVNSAKNYVIPSATMIIKLDIDRERQKLISDTKITYQIYALKDIVSNQPVFKEVYTRVSGEDLSHIPGSEMEKKNQDDSSRQSWESLFDLKAWQPYTIVTGAHNEYPLKLRKGRAGHVFENLGEDEEEFRYNNETKDLIGELIIMVESTSDLILYFKEDVKEHAGFKNGKTEYVKPDLRRHPEHPKRTVAVARFKDIQYEEAFGLRVAWRFR